MTRESRVILLAVLTLLAFAVLIYIEKGAFVPPLPLFELTFLIATVQIAWWNKEKVVPAILSVTTGIFLVLSTQLFWTFFFNVEKLTTFLNGPLPQLFRLVFILLTIVGSIFSAFKQKALVPSILSGLFLLITTVSLFEYHDWMPVLAYALMVVSTKIRSAYQPFDQLWTLLFILEGIKWVTFILH